MNFLLHHQLARRDLGDPLAAVGAMLPDVWRMLDKRIRPAHELVETSDRHVAAVLAGIAHHTRADAAFHDCAAFTAGERVLASELRAIDAPKITLFAHIAWELCLDGAWFRREGGALVARLGNDVAAATEASLGHAPIDTACRLHCATRDRPLPSAAFETRLSRVLHDLAIGTWIEGYARGDEIARRVGGIRARLGLTPLEEPAVAAFTRILDAALDRAEGALDAILTLPVAPG